MKRKGEIKDLVDNGDKLLRWGRWGKGRKIGGGGESLWIGGNGRELWEILGEKVGGDMGLGKMEVEWVEGKKKIGRWWGSEDENEIIEGR